jgi:hypothetical protein
MRGKKIRQSNFSTSKLNKVVSNNKNRYEFRVIGLPRCGKKAIAGWILSHFQGYGFFQNICPINLKHYHKLVKQIPHTKSNLISRKEGNGVGVGVGLTRFPNKLSTDSNQVNIFVIRHPMNLFASMEAMHREKYGSDMDATDYLMYRELWIQHAKCFLKPNKQSNTHLIRYEDWLQQSFRESWFKSIYAFNLTHPVQPIEHSFSYSPFTNNEYTKRYENVKDSRMLACVAKDKILHELVRLIFKR